MFSKYSKSYYLTVQLLAQMLGRRLAWGKITWWRKNIKLLSKKPVLSAVVGHSRHLQAGIEEGIAVVVESLGYRWLPVVYNINIHTLAAGDEEQQQQQQVGHHPAQSS